jgi:hypothetical protein
VVSVKIAAPRDAMPCSLVDGWRFTKLHSISFQKAVISEVNKFKLLVSFVPIFTFFSAYPE